MTSEKLQDIALVTPGTSPRGDQINSVGNGLPFFQGSKEFGALYPKPERFTEFPVKVAKSGDILISVRAPVGEVNIAQEDCSIGRGVMAVHANKESERMFIFYMLKNLQGKWDSLGSAGSVFDNLSTVALKNLEIPSGLKRDEIGQFLFNIDRKISMNFAISKTLESIAQSIFKSWFIDFDPVHAKSRGEKPFGMDDETAALFPDSFEESELGMIPRGWSTSELGEVLSVLESGKRPKGGAQNEGIPSIGAESIRNLGQFDFASTKYVSLQFFQSMNSGKVKPYDVLVYKDGAGAGAHVTMFGEGFPYEAFAINEHVFLLRSDQVPQSYLFFWLNNENYKSLMVELAQKSAQPGLNQKDMKSIPILKPESSVLSTFSKLLSPIVEMIMKNSLQNISLEQVREGLLPRLISGELQIPEEFLVS